MKRSCPVYFMPALIMAALIWSASNLPVHKAVAGNNVKSAINQSPDLYINTQYGFSFSLPDSWKGYTIVKSTWEGLAAGGQMGETILETGPQLSIRHPDWTSQNPRQDIPIMIFTIDQWKSLQQEKFHIGAAPIGPSELGRNNSYVFALPARYNYEFPKGYEEVENILNSKPLHTNK